MRTAGSAIALLCLAAGAAQAQVRTDRQPRMIIARVGMQAQAAPFDDRRTFGTGRYGLGPSGVVGLQLSLPVPLPAFSLEVAGTMSSWRDLRAVDRIGQPPLENGARARTSSIAASLRFAPASACVAGFCPYLSAGGIRKWYEFQAMMLVDDMIVDYAPNQDRDAFLAAIGARYRVGRVGLDVELSHSANPITHGFGSTSSRQSRDLSLSVGTAIPWR